METQSTCRSCRRPFIIEERHKEFYVRMDVPDPSCCPDCRLQRRLSYNNEMMLYYRTCDFSGQKIISNISPDKPYAVYKSEFWWGKEWDALEYGRDFDFSRTFFEQFKELSLAVPKVAVQTNYLLDENADYTNYAGSNKDCYMIFHADLNRDCMYGYGVKKCESCLDIFNVFDSELLYESIDCKDCYHGAFLQNCRNCTDSYFLKDCVGCKNCFCSKNLRQQQYVAFNKQLTRTQYEQLFKDRPLSSRTNLEAIQKEFAAFSRSIPERNLRMIQTEESFGDQLSNCFNVHDSFDVSEMRDGAFCVQLYNGAKDCMDLYQFGLNAELVYECSIVGYNAYRIRFSHCCTEQVSNLTYCQYCYHASDLFGCAGIRHKKYCVLNKQYEKAEYEKLSAKIIDHMKETGEWGEFFPIEGSPYAYNETTAQHYYPLTAGSAHRQGLQWKDNDSDVRYQGAQVDVPDTMEGVDESFSHSVLQCEQTGKAYRIIAQELALHRKLGLPLPVRCFEQRHKDRMSKRNPRMLQERDCAECGNSIVTTCTAQNSPQVLCERCYEQCVG